LTVAPVVRANLVLLLADHLPEHDHPRAISRVLLPQPGGTRGRRVSLGVRQHATTAARGLHHRHGRGALSAGDRLPVLPEPGAHVRGRRMSTETAIRVANVSKRYRIGRKAGSGSLYDRIGSVFSRSDNVGQP